MSGREGECRANISTLGRGRGVHTGACQCRVQGQRQCKQERIKRSSEHTDIRVCKLQMVSEPAGMYVGGSAVII